MALTPLLRKSEKSNINFRKLVDEHKEAEITTKIEETRNLKLQYIYIKFTQTTTSQINNIQDSANELAKK